MSNFHSKIEKSIIALLVLTILVTSIGAIIQIFPLFKEEIALEDSEELRPYTPLELQGFLIYQREGCYGCHSQQIRKLPDEIERYGHYSLAVESKYDYPFMWGSKRTGPDLARVGDKYSDDWQCEHLIDPRFLVPDSIMPSYSFLKDRKLNNTGIAATMHTLKLLGVPYSDEDIKNSEKDILVQAGLVDDVKEIDDFKKRYKGNIPIRKFCKTQEDITEMDALVAYLQTLGNKIDPKVSKERSW